MKEIINKRLEEFASEKDIHSEFDRNELASQISNDVVEWIRGIYREDFEGPQNGGF